jgi:Mlc titration factor MtfA (ptsG expression regulator)
MTGAIVIFTAYLLIVLISDSKERRERFIEYTELAEPPAIDKTDIVYQGATNTITQTETEAILNKHCHYYNLLAPELQEKFLYRIRNFMSRKTFIIKNDEGFKEMPVLVSASAIQLTFGLRDYLLTFYKYIRIYPQEYFSDGLFKLLAGNVEDNTITVAWNQFLKGNADTADGSNVGLHEMSHALYFQKLVIDAGAAKEFCRNYNHLLSECREAYQTEVSGRKNLYSDYADTNLQEFWAESVELFFEKPVELQTQYPSVYEGMKLVLNQDPLKAPFPIIEENSSIQDRVKNFLRKIRV